MFAMSSFISSLEVPETTQLVTRGVCRLFQNLGFGTLTEFKLSNGRRGLMMAIDRNGDFVIVEVKSSVADYRSTEMARILGIQRTFLFCCAGWFPVEITDDCGLISSRIPTMLPYAVKARPRN